jgi:hypothetical protein
LGARIRVPVSLVQDSAVTEVEPASTRTTEVISDKLSEELLVSPDKVIFGVHAKYRGTFVVSVTAMVLTAQGSSELCHALLLASMTGPRM